MTNSNLMQSAQALLKTSQDLVRLGLNRGTSGNASVRTYNEVGEAGFLITPSGIAVEDMAASDMVWMDFSGKVQGRKTPSSEWRFHLDLLAHKPQLNAVIHTHSMFATTLSTFQKDIPAFHYMIALAGGDSIRCAPYALFGSQQLSDYAIVAMQDRYACLLANHGLIAVGKNLEHALNITLAGQEKYNVNDIDTTAQLTRLYLRPKLYRPYEQLIGDAQLQMLFDFS